jgi:hypothetical protein
MVYWISSDILEDLDFRNMVDRVIKLGVRVTASALHRISKTSFGSEFF